MNRAPYPTWKFAWRIISTSVAVGFIWLRLVPWWMVAALVTVDSVTYCLNHWLKWEKAR